MRPMPDSNKRRKPTHAEIRANAKRCVYCPTALNDNNYSLEHMPPRGLFRNSHRPKGLEFGGCKACNGGTKAADSAVAFLARIDQFTNDVSGWKIREGLKFLRSAEDGAPGFKGELFYENRERHGFARTGEGILFPTVTTNTGPIGQSLLDVFGAKLGMALYHEHVGEPLPVAGGVHTMGFLNAGLSEETAEGLLRTLPVFDTLKMGKQEASGQFAYRFNSDDRSIVAALAHFHNNVHFFVIAMAEPTIYGFPRPMPFSAFIRPGELLANMPKRRPAILMPLLNTERFPSLLLPTRNH